MHFEQKQAADNVDLCFGTQVTHAGAVRALINLHLTLAGTFYLLQSCVPDAYGVDDIPPKHLTIIAQAW